MCAVSWHAPYEGLTSLRDVEFWQDMRYAFNLHLL